MNTTEQLNIAQANKKDEFYTQYEDIKKELIYYKPFFKDKVVYCNCDKYSESNFTKYFVDYFDELGLKKLICTNYVPEPNLLNVVTVYIPAHKYEYYGNGKDFLRPLINGDFRSEECTEILDEADVVVTNPPFSLFREFVAKMFRHKKKFLIIGNVNAISYKETFMHILRGEMWLGQSIHSGDREFRVPDNYPLEAYNSRMDSDGNKYIRVKGVRWFTNIDCNERHRKLKLTERYVPERYPKFDNIDAINVGRTKDIPYNYNGVMGVPITFLDWFNPDQFELIGNEYTLRINGGRGYVNGQRMYGRIFIKRNPNNIEVEQHYYTGDLFEQHTQEMVL